jgi:hypothetical protein
MVRKGLQNQSGTKDWTYFSRRTPSSGTGQQTLTFFDSVASNQLDNIPTANQFPSAMFFHLHKVGFSIIPVSTAILSLANLYQAILAVFATGILRLKVVNETYFEIPLLKFGQFQPVVGPDATVKMSSGNMWTNGEMKLNSRVEFEKGASFNYGIDFNPGVAINTLVSFEARLSGYLLEYDANATKHK